MNTRRQNTALATLKCRPMSIAALLVVLPLMGAAQQPPKVPDSVSALAKKYDETRKKMLGPILDSFADELKLKVVPALTRGGKADAAIKIGQGAEALKKSAVPVLPWADAPFPADVFAMVQVTPEWQVFSIKFIDAEASLNDSYKRSLEREKTLFQNKGDPYGMVAIDNEVKRVEALKTGAGTTPAAAASAPPAAGKTPADATAPPAGKGRVTAGDKRRIESWIVGKTWAAETEEDQLLYFAKDGKGARRLRGEVTNVLEWRMQDDGTVTVTRAGWGKRITFLNANEAVVEYTDGRPGEGFKMKLSSEVIEEIK